MTPQKLQPGPLRDALAALSEHTRGGEALTATALGKRTGLPYHTARRRLRGLESQGLAAVAMSLDGEQEYTITDAGRAMLT
jgi:DNA-binding IclR family transcriptional regulator